MRFEKLFILLFLFASVSNASAVTVTLNQSTLNLSEGQTFDVSVIIDPEGTAISGAQMNLQFDRSRLNVNSISEGALFKQNGTGTFFNGGEINNSLGTVVNVFGAFLGPYNITTPGEFIIIKATAISSGSTEIKLLNALVVDPSGNTVFPAPISTPSPENNQVSIMVSGGGAPGGGGSGGGSSGENYTNIESTEKYDLFIYKDVTTSYDFRKNQNPILFVNITGNTNSVEITTLVEVLKNTSTLVEYSPTGIVYKNVNIWVGNYGYATQKNIKHAEIKFRVPIEWLEANNIDPESIELMHYNGSWESLPIKKIDVNNGNIIYEASANSFSPFAIIGKKTSNKNDFKNYQNIETTLNLENQDPQEKKSDVIPEDRSISIIYLLVAIFAGIMTISVFVHRIRKSKRK